MSTFSTVLSEKNYSDLATIRLQLTLARRPVPSVLARRPLRKQFLQWPPHDTALQFFWRPHRHVLASFFMTCSQTFERASAKVSHALSDSHHQKCPSHNSRDRIPIWPKIVNHCNGDDNVSCWGVDIPLIFLDTQIMSRQLMTDLRSKTMRNIANVSSDALKEFRFNSAYFPSSQSFTTVAFLQWTKTWSAQLCFFGIFRFTFTTSSSSSAYCSSEKSWPLQVGLKSTKERIVCPGAFNCEIQVARQSITRFSTNVLIRRQWSNEPLLLTASPEHILISHWGKLLPDHLPYKICFLLEWPGVVAPLGWEVGDGVWRYYLSRESKETPISCLKTIPFPPGFLMMGSFPLVSKS